MQKYPVGKELKQNSCIGIHCSKLLIIMKIIIVFFFQRVTHLAREKKLIFHEALYEAMFKS